MEAFVFFFPKLSTKCHTSSKAILLNHFPLCHCRVCCVKRTQCSVSCVNTFLFAFLEPTRITKTLPWGFVSFLRQCASIYRPSRVLPRQKPVGRSLPRMYFALTLNLRQVINWRIFFGEPFFCRSTRMTRSLLIAEAKLPF